MYEIKSKYMKEIKLNTRKYTNSENIVLLGQVVNLIWKGAVKRKVGAQVQVIEVGNRMANKSRKPQDANVSTTRMLSEGENSYTNTLVHIY